MKFCPVVPGPQKERKKNNNNEKQSKNNKSPNNRCLGDLISLVAGHAVVLKKLKMWKVYDIRMPNIFFFYQKSSSETLAQGNSVTNKYILTYSPSSISSTFPFANKFTGSNTTYNKFQIHKNRSTENIMSTGGL